MEYKLPFAEYNEALKKGKLLGLKCKDCGFITIPAKMVCRKCSSTNLEIVQLKGTGKITTFTTVFVAAEARECECPYTIVMVELDEGPWIMGNLFVDPNRATMENLIGKRVDFGVKVFPGDKYSAGMIARPQFSLAQ